MITNGQIESRYTKGSLFSKAPNQPGLEILSREINSGQEDYFLNIKALKTEFWALCVQ